MGGVAELKLVDGADGVVADVGFSLPQSGALGISGAGGDFDFLFLIVNVDVHASGCAACEDDVYPLVELNDGLCGDDFV